MTFAIDTAAVAGVDVSAAQRATGFDLKEYMAMGRSVAGRMPTLKNAAATFA